MNIQAGGAVAQGANSEAVKHSDDEGEYFAHRIEVSPVSTLED